MSKKVLIISTSLRKKSNSEALAKEFLRGAKENGNEVEFVTLQNKTINFCKGCLACLRLGKCTIKDDMTELVNLVKESDVLVFATPIYYYEMSGQMKTFLDRLNPLFSSDYKFREIYLLITAADTEKTAADGAIKGLSGWISCFEKCKLKKVIMGLGAEGVGTIGDEALDEAYQTGKAV